MPLYPAATALPFPGGTEALPGLPIGSLSTGWAQLAGFPHTLTACNEFQGVDPSINYKLHILDNKQLLIGAPTPEAVLPNQSAVEITYAVTPGGGAGPMVVGQWASASAAAEPDIHFRSTGTNIGDPGAVPAGYSLGSDQWQGDDGLTPRTENRAAANFICRVKPGSVPIPGSVRGLAGDFLLATAVGDGVTPITSQVQINNTGINVVFGELQLGGVTVIDSDLNLHVAGFRSVRHTIDDDDVLILPVLGGTAAMAHVVSTNSAAANAPAGFFWCRVNTLIAPILTAAFIGAGNVTVGTGALTAGTTDGTDGNLNLFTDAVGNLYVKNRLGGLRVLAITFFPAGVF